MTVRYKFELPYGTGSPSFVNCPASHCGSSLGGVSLLVYDLMAKVAKLEAENEALRQASDINGAESVHWHGQYMNQRETICSLQKEKEKLETELLQIRIRKDQHKSEYDRVAKLYNEKFADHRNMVDACCAADERVKELELKNRDLSQEIESLKSEKCSVEGENAELQAMVDKLRAEIDSLKRTTVGITDEKLREIKELVKEAGVEFYAAQTQMYNASNDQFNAQTKLKRLGDLLSGLSSSSAERS